MQHSLAFYDSCKCIFNEKQYYYGFRCQHNSANFDNNQKKLSKIVDAVYKNEIDANSKNKFYKSGNYLRILMIIAES